MADHNEEAPPPGKRSPHYVPTFAVVEALESATTLWIYKVHYMPYFTYYF